MEWEFFRMTHKALVGFLGLHDQVMRRLDMVDTNVAALKAGLDQLKQDVADVAAKLKTSLGTVSTAIDASDEATLVAAVAEIADIHTALAAIATPAA
jgi:hypothetical protein